MQALQHKASEWSGVPTSDAFALTTPISFPGLAAFNLSSTSLPISTTGCMMTRKKGSYEFLAQRMGGLPLYSQRRGHPALIARHRPFPVTHEAAERWLHHMQQAMASTREIDEESKIKMMNFLRLIYLFSKPRGIIVITKHTAYFLVAGVELKNQNQVMMS